MTEKTPPMPNDPDFLGAQQAIKRAAKRARELADATNTAYLVVKDGKLVDLRRKSEEPTQ